MMLLLVAVTSVLVVSCKEDENTAAEGTDREFMTMFINDNNRGKGGDYPYNCGLDGAYPHGNTIHLYWYGVKECAGYQIQMAIQNKVSGGSSAWAKVQAVIVDPAAIKASSLMVIGAIKLLLHPTNTLLPITVLLFFLPS